MKKRKNKASNLNNSDSFNWGNAAFYLSFSNIANMLVAVIMFFVFPHWFFRVLDMLNWGLGFVGLIGAALGIVALVKKSKTKWKPIFAIASYIVATIFSLGMGVIIGIKLVTAG
ncbi:hypothetical protein ACFLZN_01910 [Nanoarchaeota archaeon]